MSKKIKFIKNQLDKPDPPIWVILLYRLVYFIFISVGAVSIITLGFFGLSSYQTINSDFLFVMIFGLMVLVGFTLLLSGLIPYKHLKNNFIKSVIFCFLLSFVPLFLYCLLTLLMVGMLATIILLGLFLLIKTFLQYKKII